MYYNAEINEYRKEDIPSLKRLWTEVFGDDAALVDRFFELLPSMGTALVAECGGEIAGAAYILQSELWKNGVASAKLGYIYAVAVEPEARGCGIGAELVRSCLRFCWGDRIDICCTLPAESSLYGWYAESAGLLPASYCVYEDIPAGKTLSGIKRLCADEYGFLRHDLLKHGSYINHYYGWLLYEEALLRAYGGGFFAYGDALVCGYIEDGVLLVKEAINDPPELIPALCSQLGANSARVRRISAGGEPYIAAFEPENYPPDTAFGLTLD